MVRHQAECINFAFIEIFPFSQVIKIVTIVIVQGKNRLAIMATLDDVMGIVRYDDSGCSGMGGRYQNQR